MIKISLGLTILSQLANFVRKATTLKSQIFLVEFSIKYHVLKSTCYFVSELNPLILYKVWNGIQIAIFTQTEKTNLFLSGHRLGQIFNLHLQYGGSDRKISVLILKSKKENLLNLKNQTTKSLAISTQDTQPKYLSTILYFFCWPFFCTQCEKIYFKNLNCFYVVCRKMYQTISMLGP